MTKQEPGQAVHAHARQAGPAVQAHPGHPRQHENQRPGQLAEEKNQAAHARSLGVERLPGKKRLPVVPGAGKSLSIRIAHLIADRKGCVVPPCSRWDDGMIVC
jgi:hypothetical protein